MCGIVGYVGWREPIPLLVDGLRLLEYRGYDSAGVAVVEDGRIQVVRAPGRLDELVRKLERQPLRGRSGLGHTRWATHGRPSERNAHPHVDSRGRVAVIHNGIIENFAELRAELADRGWTFTSDTDTEVVANLVSAELEHFSDLAAAVRSATRRLAGSYAFAAVTSSSRDLEEIVAARNGPPLVVAAADNERFLASDATALLRYTKDVIFLENGDVARLGRNETRIWNQAGLEVERPVRHLSWDAVAAEKNGYPHFMLKEIYEQPQAIFETYAGRADFDANRVDLAEMGLPETRLRQIRAVHLLACGTSWHAALIGKFLIEELARLPVQVDYGSEYRYRDPIVDRDVLAIGITQSGETADTLAAMAEAKTRGALLATLCNVAGSEATRISDGALITRAGPEIGVASTKAFTTQLVALYLLALYLRGLRFGSVEPSHVRALAQLPEALSGALAEDGRIAEIAARYSGATSFLFLGRGIQYPLALEGALKLKEISYIHAEGYPSGEMKHGPIALIDSELPTVALATGNGTFEKTLGNLQEIKARDGKVLVVSDHPTRDLQGCADEVLPVPTSTPLLQPVVNAVALQLLAYHVAQIRGTDVDKPRNLAKSVTVE